MVQAELEMAEERAQERTRIELTLENRRLLLSKSQFRVQQAAKKAAKAAQELQVKKEELELRARTLSAEAAAAEREMLLVAAEVAKARLESEQLQTDSISGLASGEEQRHAEGIQRGAVSDKPIRFSGFSRAYGELASYYPASFHDENGEQWRSAEHYFQAQKFESPEAKAEISGARTPLAAHALGGERRAEVRMMLLLLLRLLLRVLLRLLLRLLLVLTSLLQRAIRADWDEVRQAVLERATMWKFEQNDRCRQVLLSTAERKLVLNDADDPYWGAGKPSLQVGRDSSSGTTTYEGSNRLGHMLERVRARLRAKEEPDGSMMSSAGQPRRRGKQQFAAEALE